MRKILFIPIFVVLITVLSLLPEDAHATTSIDLKDQASCEAAPLSGTWTDANSTCRIGTLTLNSGDSLVIYNSVLTITGTLTNNAGSSIQLGAPPSTSTPNPSGSLYNEGTFNNYGAIKQVACSDIGCPAATIYNTGTINNNSGGTISIIWVGKINNYSNGTIINNSGGAINSYDGNIYNYGTITNNGTIFITGTFTNESGGTITNNSGGTINNNPGGIIITNSGTITNNSGGTMTFTGTINNYGTISNSGTFNCGLINYSCFIPNYGTFTNNSGGAVYLKGAIYITNYSGGTINNSGTIYYYSAGTSQDPGYTINNSGGTINNYGAITSNSGRHISNSGTINNHGIFSNYGPISNSGTITNYSGGTITNYSKGTITNYSGGIITNSGTINNHGTITNNSGATINNNGKIKDYCGSTFTNNGAFTGNQVKNVCDPTTTAVTPNPSSVVHGNTIKFNATVTDTSSSPTTPAGTVSWNDGSAGGGFSSGTCTLVSTSSSQSYCQVTYTAPSTTGSVTITAKYLGNSTHMASSGTSVLTVS